MHCLVLFGVRQRRANTYGEKDLWIIFQHAQVLAVNDLGINLENLYI